MSEIRSYPSIRKNLSMVGKGKSKVRKRLIGEMLRHRDLVRVIVAPSGYGKTCLAYKYAELTFGEKHTIWLDVGGPEILYYLDAESFSMDMIKNFEKQTVVVFDDLPFLNDARRNTFKKVVKALLSEGCEVVVTMRPTFNLDMILGDACDLIPAQELKLGYGEIMDCYNLRNSVLRENQGPYLHCKFKSIPSLAWGDEIDAKKFFLSLNDDGLTNECRAAIFAILVLQEGNIEDINNVTKRFKNDFQKFLIRHYPHLGLDHTSGKFNVCRMSIGAIHEIFREDSDAIVSGGTRVQKAFFFESLANILMREKDFSRAACLIRCEYPFKNRFQWIERHQGSFHAAGFLDSMNLVVESIEHQPHLSLQILLGSFLRCVAYRDWAKGKDLFRRIVTHRQIVQVHKIMVYLLSLRFPVYAISEKSRVGLLELTEGVDICPSFIDPLPNSTYTTNRRKKASVSDQLNLLEEVLTYFSGLVVRNRFTDFEEAARFHLQSFAENDILMIVLIVAYRICGNESMARLAGDVLNVRCDEGMPVTLYEAILFDSLFMRCVNSGSHMAGQYAKELSLNASFFGTDEHALLHDIAPYLEDVPGAVPSQLSEQKLDDYLNAFYLRERLSDVMSMYDIASRQYFSHKRVTLFSREGGAYEELSYKKCPAGVARYIHPQIFELLDFTAPSIKRCRLDSISDRDKTCNCLQTYTLNSIYRKG